MSGDTYTTKEIIQFGRSIGVIIPAEISKRHGIKAGDKTVFVESGDCVKQIFNPDIRVVELSERRSEGVSQ